MIDVHLFVSATPTFKLSQFIACYHSYSLKAPYKVIDIAGKCLFSHLLVFAYA